MVTFTTDEWIRLQLEELHKKVLNELDEKTKLQEELASKIARLQDEATVLRERADAVKKLALQFTPQTTNNEYGEIPVYCGKNGQRCYSSCKNFVENVTCAYATLYPPKENKDEN